MSSLTEIAMRINDASDKTSKPVYFYDRYEPFFAPLKDQAISILELGVHKGESLKVFSSYFSKGKVIGVDIKGNGVDVSKRSVIREARSNWKRFVRGIRRMDSTLSLMMLRTMVHGAWCLAAPCFLN